MSAHDLVLLPWEEAQQIRAVNVELTIGECTQAVGRLSSEWVGARWYTFRWCTAVRWYEVRIGPMRAPEMHEYVARAWEVLQKRPDLCEALCLLYEMDKAEEERAIAAREVMFPRESGAHGCAWIRDTFAQG